MSLRRSARPRSEKPPAQASEAIAKKVPRSQSFNSTKTKKRPAPSEHAPSPPPKRSRTSSPQQLVNGRSPLSRRSTSRTVVQETDDTAPKKSHLKKSPTLEKRTAPVFQLKPYLNPLPKVPEVQHPGLQLFVWGAGNFGQFGMGPNILGELDKPKKSPWAEEKIKEGVFGDEGAGLRAVAAGALHSLLIDEKGTVWTCGVNDDAALGRVTQNVPDPSNPGSFLDLDELTSIPHPLQSLVDEKFRAAQVTTGDSICAALSGDGQIRVWGSFRVNEGSLGFSSGLKHQFRPVPILALRGRPGDVEKASAIAAGSNHILVLTTHGHIFTWGAGEQGQLGRKVLERRKIHGTVPEKVTLGRRSRKAIRIGAGSFHSFAVDDKGDVWAWGLNSMGQTGTGYQSEDDFIIQSPQKVRRLGKKELGNDSVVQIAGGNHHTLFLTAGGKVYACGRCNGGQLGLEDDEEEFKNRANADFIPEPVLIKFPDSDDPVVQISSGPHNNMAITAAGALYCWGQGPQGELGVPDEEVRTPRMIVRKEGGAWAAISVSCGGQHTLGLFRKK